MEPTQSIQVSSDPETKGFDLSAGKTWIYPENYPLRDYQFNIVQACLYKNTLVCLPTGLGKTFIAAVIMYNFWRWYPCGKVMFLAPTRPLVTQQIVACHNVMGIPTVETVELTGVTAQKEREVAWLEKRVVFATPQVVFNDLYQNVVPADLIKCVVIDEAHRALGKHSYCQCIKMLSEKNKNFRVVALSATPGNKIDNVHQVLQNLLIAHVELRDESSLDIIPYINERKLDIIVVPHNNELMKYKDRYIFIMDRHVKVLLQHNVLRGDTANISKGRIYHLLTEFQKKTNKSGNYGQIIGTLSRLMTMYHGYEVMIRDGLRAFHKFYQNHSDKYWMSEETQLLELLEDIKEYLGPFPDIKTIHECNAADISRDLVFGHAKFEKLKELLLHHFTSCKRKQVDTRAIVFVEYRDIVNEIYVLLLQCQPLIRPQMFVGKAGQKQRQQMKALLDFRSNHVNVLISTSIGEEGLDVGEVDLIICFDVSQHSPIRLVQRMGRTGRKRDGHVIILVTDGKEHETLKSAMARRISLNDKILNTNNIISSLYQNNPRMVPDAFKPECLKMHITVQSKTSFTKRKNRKVDKENNKRENTLRKITALDSYTKSQKDDNKFSMTKFFTAKKRKEHADNNVDIPGSDTSRNKIATKPSDVKILSCDNDAIEFLTICALRNSEKETDRGEKCKIDQIYLPKLPRIKNVFSLVVPDIKILDCLTTLEDVVPLNRNLHKNENKDKSKSNNLCNDERALVSTTKQIKSKYTIEKSEFEDLLDDSSKSNESDIPNIEEEEDCKNDNSNCVLMLASEQYSDRNISETMDLQNQADVLDNSEPGVFEDILNETSSDSGSVIYVESIQAEQSSNNIKFEDNNGSCSTDLRQTIEANDDYNSISKSRNITNTGTGIVKDSPTPNLTKSEGELILSITQAIEEIERLNSKSSKVVKMTDESEDDMFREESFFTELDNDTETIKEVDDLFKNCKSNDKTVPDESTNLDEWDDDFEISTVPLRDSTKFNLSKVKNQKSIGAEHNVKMQEWDSEKWISVDKSCIVPRKDTPASSIAKRLSNARKNWDSRLDRRKKFVSDKCNLNNSTEREEGKKSSFFFDDSDDNVDHDALRKGTNRDEETKCSEKHIRGNRKRRKINEFIEDQAEVSLSNYTSDESSETDVDLDGFVSYTQNVHETSDMHIHYLKSVKSPIKRQQGFIFKEPRIVNRSVKEIYSQGSVEEDDSYLNDSFCVEVDENEPQDVTVAEELCELERAELELEKRKRKRKRKRKYSNNEALNCNAKEKEESSSEDEIENLRKQIMDDSIILVE